MAWPKKGKGSDDDDDSTQVEAKTAAPPSVEPEEPEKIDQVALNKSCDFSIANARIQARRRLLKREPELLAIFDKREAEKVEKAEKAAGKAEEKAEKEKSRH